jgi:uncharacterized protein (TIGR03435 family)
VSRKLAIWSILAVLPVMYAAFVHAQAPALEINPSFEVVSVKPSGTNANTMTGPGASVVHTFSWRYSGQRVSCDLPLKSIVEEAFSLKDYQIDGPDWLAKKTYALSALMPAGTTRETAPLMLRSMLKERFGFRYHREQKDLPAYVLLQAKRGFKLHPVDSDRAANRSIDTPLGKRQRVGWVQMPGRFTAPDMSLDDFAGWLKRQMDAPVMNMTKIPGRYSFDLQWEPEKPLGSGEGSRFDSELLSLMDRQLGLKLERQKVPCEILVIDHADDIPAQN